MARLTSLDALPPTVQKPAYTPAAHGAGIVHIGFGAFHKAHQAVYTDEALAASGGDWRIIGVSLRSPEPAQELTPQGGLFTVIERSASGTQARVIGSVHSALCLSTDRGAVLNALVAPETRIVSLTVTEKGYGVNRSTGGIDPAHPAIKADLADPANPQGVAGLLVWALGQRRKQGTPPFTVLSCDNLPENGALTRSLMIDFARHTAPELIEYIATEVAFPSSMVDRITPARTDATLALAEELIDRHDAAAIECEAFRQWVIEDHFPTGRPYWEAGGAIFAPDITPYEAMKLRMLNGTHSMLAYAGFLCGHKYVRDVMADPELATLVERYLKAAAATLDPLDGVDFEVYARDLAERFRNTHLGHETYQIAMDGSEKMPQRVFAAALVALRRGQSLALFAFATAAWIRYTFGHGDDGSVYVLRDPRQAELAPNHEDQGVATAVDHVLGLPGLCPSELRTNIMWRSLVEDFVARMKSVGVAGAVKEAAR